MLPSWRNQSVREEREKPLVEKSRAAYQQLNASSVGLEMGISVLIGLLFGRWLDGHAGTTPWLMILFVMLGFAAGFRGVLREVKRADRAAARADAAAGVDPAAPVVDMTTPPPAIAAEVPELTPLRREVGRS